MPRRRLAVITARAASREQKDIICGISYAALAADTDVVVFSNIYNYPNNDEALNFENIIYDFFDPNDFDGVIITAEAFMELSIIEAVIKKIRASHIPSVVVGDRIEGFECLNFDDGKDMFNICEHLIVNHGLKDIDILTGFKDSDIAKRRVNGCRKAFEKHGIPFDESKVYYGNFWYDSGYNLAMKYVSGELKLPQAVICTNDYMAYELCRVLTDAGIRIPEDVSVTGYDCTGGRIYYSPILTTYQSDRRGLGVRAANLLLSTNYEYYSGDRFLVGSTCKCGTNPRNLNKEIFEERIEHPITIVNNKHQFNTPRFSQELTSCKALGEYLKVINSYAFLHDADRLHICLDKEWNGSEYGGEEFLHYILDGSDTINKLNSMPKKGLISSITEEGNEPSVYYLSPLCYQTRLYGITALSYIYPQNFKYQIRSWNEIISNSIELLRLKNDIHYLTLCQKTSSLYDSLTGFCKLGEFKRCLSESKDKANGVVAVKLCLSNENDRDLNSSQSNIISSIAIAIKQVCTNHEVLCRTDDDVFLILCYESKDSISEKIRVLLHRDVYAKYFDSVPLLIYAEHEGCSAKDIDLIFSEVAEAEMAKSEEYHKSTLLPKYDSLFELRKDIASQPQSSTDIADASKRLCISEGYFRSVYKKCFGVSYVQDCINEKIILAKYLLCTTVMSIYTIAIQCGYKNEKYFAWQFHQSVGCSPAQYRKRYCGKVGSV